MRLLCNVANRARNVRTPLILLFVYFKIFKVFNRNDFVSFNLEIQTGIYVLKHMHRAVTLILFSFLPTRLEFSCLVFNTHRVKKTVKLKKNKKGG
jgi:hypothetical protein